MRFCESYYELMRGPVKPSDQDFEALQELFPHPLTKNNKRWQNLTCEHIIFNVSPEKWRDTTEFDEDTREEITKALARETYPVSLYVKEYGWLIILSPGTLRNVLFAKFQQYADRKLAILAKTRQKQLELTEETESRTKKRARSTAKG